MADLSVTVVGSRDAVSVIGDEVASPEGRTLLTPSDVTYVGCFALPETWGTFNGSSTAAQKYPRGLTVMYIDSGSGPKACVATMEAGGYGEGHQGKPYYGVSAFEVPETLLTATPTANERYYNAPVATQRANYAGAFSEFYFTDNDGTDPSWTPDGSGQVGGVGCVRHLFWDAATSRLWAQIGVGYTSTGDIATLACCSLSGLAGQQTATLVGRYSSQEGASPAYATPGNHFKYIQAGFSVIPSWFQSAYSVPRFAVFGGTSVSGAVNHSAGPAVRAWTVPGDDLDGVMANAATTVLEHHWDDGPLLPVTWSEVLGHPAARPSHEKCRQGPSDQNPGVTVASGAYTYAGPLTALDKPSNFVWIDTGTKHGLFGFYAIGNGDIGYCMSNGHIGSWESYAVIVNPADLALVKTGAIGCWQPTMHWTLWNHPQCVYPANGNTLLDTYMHTYEASDRVGDSVIDTNDGSLEKFWYGNGRLQAIITPPIAYDATTQRLYVLAYEFNGGGTSNNQAGVFVYQVT